MAPKLSLENTLEVDLQPDVSPEVRSEHIVANNNISESVSRDEVARALSGNSAVNSINPNATSHADIVARLRQVQSTSTEDARRREIQLEIQEQVTAEEQGRRAETPYSSHERGLSPSQIASMQGSSAQIRAFQGDIRSVEGRDSLTLDNRLVTGTSRESQRRAEEFEQDDKLEINKKREEDTRESVERSADTETDSRLEAERRAEVERQRQAELERQRAAEEAERRAEAERAAERRDAFEREARELAENNAKRNFKDSNSLSEQAEKDLVALQEKYGLTKDEFESIANKYAERVQERAAKHEWDNMSWLEKKIHQFGEWTGINSLVKSIKKTVDKISSKVAKAVDAVKETVTKVVEVGKNLAHGAAIVGKLALDAVTDPQNLLAAVKGLAHISNPVTWLKWGANAATFMTRGDTWDAIGAGIAKGWDKFTDVETWKSAGRAIGNALTDPMTAVYALGEVTGATDALMFFKKGGECLLAVAAGDMDKAKLLAMEAAMHGTFAVMSIGAIVTTGGVALAGVAALRAGAKALLKEGVKAALEVVVKEGFESVGKVLAKEVVEGLGKEALQSTATHAAQATLKEVGEELAEKAAKGALQDLTAEAAQVMTRDIAEKHVASAVKEIVSEQVENVVHKWGKDAIKNPKAFTEAVEALGIDKKTAERMQKELVKGKADREIKEALAKEMQEPIEKHVRDGMKDTFEKNLDEGIDALKSKHGLADDVADGMKRGGREGFEKGVKRGVKEGVEEGIENAFRRLRGKKRLHFEMPKTETKPVETRGVALEAREEQEYVRRSYIDEKTKFAQTGEAVEIRSGLAEAESVDLSSAAKTKNLDDAGSLYSRDGHVNQVAEMRERLQREQAEVRNLAKDRPLGEQRVTSLGADRKKDVA